MIVLFGRDSAALSPGAEAQSFDRACFMPNHRSVVKEFIPVLISEHCEIDAFASQHAELFGILANWQNRPSVIAPGRKVAGKPFCGDKSVRISLLIHTNGAEKSFGGRTAFIHFARARTSRI